MTYHPLTNDTAQTPERRAEEARELVDKLVDSTGDMCEREADFITSMAERLEKYGTRTVVSPKQLFWLRDLVEKYG